MQQSDYNCNNEKKEYFLVAWGYIGYQLKH